MIEPAMAVMAFMIILSGLASPAYADSSCLDVEKTAGDLITLRVPVSDPERYSFLWAVTTDGKTGSESDITVYDEEGEEASSTDPSFRFVIPSGYDTLFVTLSTIDNAVEEGCVGFSCTKITIKRPEGCPKFESICKGSADEVTYSWTGKKEHLQFKWELRDENGEDVTPEGYGNWSSDISSLTIDWAGFKDGKYTLALYVKTNQAEENNAIVCGPTTIAVVSKPALTVSSS